MSLRVRLYSKNFASVFLRSFLSFCADADIITQNNILAGCTWQDNLLIFISFIDMGTYKC